MRKSCFLALALWHDGLKTICDNPSSWDRGGALFKAKRYTGVPFVQTVVPEKSVDLNVYLCADAFPRVSFQDLVRLLRYNLPKQFLVWIVFAPASFACARTVAIRMGGGVKSDGAVQVGWANVGRRINRINLGTPEVRHSIVHVPSTFASIAPTCAVGQSAKWLAVSFNCSGLNNVAQPRLCKREEVT